VVTEAMEQWLYDPVGMLYLGGPNASGRMWGTIIAGEAGFLIGRTFGIPGLGTLTRFAGGWLGSYLPCHISWRNYADRD